MTLAPTTAEAIGDPPQPHRDGTLEGRAQSKANSLLDGASARDSGVWLNAIPNSSLCLRMDNNTHCRSGCWLLASCSFHCFFLCA